MRKNEPDILHGPIIGNIIIFIAPLMCTNMLQTLYSAADMIVVGMSGVSGAIGAIGTTVSFVNLIINVLIGLSIGSGIIVARKIGEGNAEEVQEAVHTSAVVAFVVGLFSSAVGLAFSERILALMGDSGHILELATKYLRIYFSGVVFVSLTNFFISILRAKGDTKTPLVVITVSGLINVLLNLFFVLCCSMSVDGVALATVISNVVSSFMLVFHLCKNGGVCKLSFKKLRINLRSLKLILINGIPSSIQSALFSLSNVLIQSNIIGLNNTMCPGGSDIIDGNAAANSLEIFVNQGSNSAAQAAITFTSQHYGARSRERMGMVIRNCYLTGIVFVSSIAFLMLIIHRPVIGLYVSSPLAVQTARLRLFMFFTVYALEVAMEVGSGILRGLNKSMLSASVTLIGACGLRIVLLYTMFKANPTVNSLYLLYPITWFATSLCHLIFVIVEYKKFRFSPS